MAKGRKRPTRQKPSITPRRPEQYAVSGVSQEQQRLIGLVVLNWSKLEANIDDTIWHFLNFNLDEGRVITNRLNADLKITLLRSLAHAYLSEEDFNEVETRLLYYIAIYQEDRNFIVHGSWGTLMPENVPVCTSLRPNSPTPGEVIAETFPEERMINLINGINEAITGLKILMARLDAALEKQPEPSPDP
jgi:hypothetical protein